MLGNERSGKGAEPVERRSVGALLDGTLGFLLLILTTAVIAVIRDGFRQPEVLPIALVYAAVMLLVARRHTWRVRDYMRRLRRKRTSDESPGTG